MKTKIQTIYPDSEFGQNTASYLYVADFSERTNSARKIEIHNTLPKTPEEDKDMDCLIIYNPKKLSIDYNIFNDHQFKDDEKKDIQHCECCLFPTVNHDSSWLAFVEIKDCKVKNISDYKSKVKEQIISTVQLFKDLQIIGNQQIYGIISFPRKKKADFNQTIFEDYTEYKQLYKEHRIRFYPTNKVTVNDDCVLTLNH